MREYIGNNIFFERKNESVKIFFRPMSHFFGNQIENCYFEIFIDYRQMVVVFNKIKTGETLPFKNLRELEGVRHSIDVE